MLRRRPHLSTLLCATVVQQLLLFSCNNPSNPQPSIPPPTLAPSKPPMDEMPPPKPTLPLPPPSKEQLNFARSLSQTFTQIASQAGPSVVSIRVEGRQKLPGFIPGGDRFFGIEPGEDGFPFERQGPAFEGAGSGFVVDERGFVATNRHVIQNADKIEVVFGDGKKFKAQVVGADARLDIAVIKVLNLNGYKLQAAKLGNSSQLQPGEWVMAIGNPFGLDHTVTVGVISAMGRKISDLPDYQDLIQTDASINQGNSGGPLINLDGEVVGINTMIVGPGNIGIGFAIPTNLAKSSISDLIATGKVLHPYIGIAVRPLSEQNQEILENALGIQNQGVMIGRVTAHSPAEQGGVIPGDVLLKIDGQPVNTYAEVAKLVSAHKIGDTLNLEILRRWKKPSIMIQVKTEEFPSDIHLPEVRPPVGLHD